jgi:superfamily I DNA/RNA helicase
MDEPTKMAFRKWSVSSPVDDHTKIMTHHRPEDSTSTRPNLVSKAPNSDIEEPVKQRVPRSSFSPTEEQIAVIEGAKQHTDIAVEALAGTGKTTTLKLLADSKVGLKGTYVAFNKSIVDEAKAKFPSSVHCSTAHGLAYQSIGREFASRLQSTQRLSFKQIAEWLEAGAFGFKSSISNHVLDPAQMAQHAQATVRNFCKSIDPEISTQHVKMPVIIEAHSPNAKAFAMAVLPLAKKIWTDLLLQQGFMKFNHDHYLKMWQLGKPTIGSDFILFDEAQDADPVMLDVVNSQSSSQLVYCGDQFQAIYEWRGAKNALTMVNVDEHLWLTQSFRFGPAIAKEANQFLALLNCPKMVKGSQEVQSSLKRIPNPDAILCRTNAGVIAAIMGEQSKNRSVSIIGRPEELIGFAEACQKLMTGGRTGHPELAPFLNWEGVRDFVEEYPDEAQDIKTMVRLVDSFGTERLISSLHDVVTEKQADVVVSTAHRAKGREWNDVRLQGDFLHADDMDSEDLRLAYVAITRAKRTLDMTSWDTISPRDSQKQPDRETAGAGKNRPALVVESKPKQKDRKGIASRLKRSNKPVEDWADRI